MLQLFFTNQVFRIIKDKEQQWELKRRFPTIFFNPKMRIDEFEVFEDICKNKKVFLEYGSGGSTIYFLKHKKEVFSVESNQEFHTYMNSIKLVRQSSKTLLHYNFIDVGPTDKWGRPLTVEKENNWFQYYCSIWNQLNPEETKVDVVFIDGRFRVCCCLYSILKAVEYGWNDIIFIFHDFWNRDRYHVVLPFLQEYKSQSTLAAFTMKKDINTEEVKCLLEKYSFDIQ